MSCIFCKIVNGELPSSIIYEDENHIAILDLFPVTEGHTLLIPKRHHENIFDAIPELSEHIYPKLAKISNAIKQATNCPGINIIQNNGKEAGQIVFHSHIHIIPRYGIENLPLSVAGKKQATTEKLNEVANKIKQYI